MNFWLLYDHLYCTVPIHTRIRKLRNYEVANMPDQVVAAQGRARGQAPAQEDGRGGWGGGIKQAIQIFLVVQVVQYGVQYFMTGRNSPSSTGGAESTSSPANASMTNGSGTSPAAPAINLPNLVPLWPQGTIFDVHCFVTVNPYELVSYDRPALPHVTFTGLKLGDWAWKEHWSTEISLPKVSLSTSSVILVPNPTSSLRTCRTMPVSS